MTTDPVDLSEEHRDMLRRDWSVRVLDAYEGVSPHCPAVCGHCGHFAHAGGDAARHAAALAVYPTLPADVRAQLGECP